MKKFLRRLPLLLFLFGVAAALAYGFRPQPIPVDLASVERGSMRVTVDEDGKTRVKQRYVITAPLAGKLRRVPWKAGADLQELYTQSRPLAVLEPTPVGFQDATARRQAEDRRNAAQARVEQTKELLKKAQKQESFARSEYHRVERSSAGGGASRQELDETEMKLRVAERDLVANQFAVQIARFELQQAEAALLPAGATDNGKPYEIYSPIERGTILRVAQESERVVTPGTEIMEIGDTQHLEAEIDVLTQDAVKIPKNAPVELVHWGGEVPLHGRVTGRESGFMKQSALGVEEQRVNILVDFTVPKEYRGQLGDAYRVEARIEVWKGENVLKVKSGALFRHARTKDWAVYVREGDRAVLRSIKIGQNNGLEAEVLEGLQEGEQVILHPGDKIKEGVQIAVRE